MLYDKTFPPRSAIQGKINARTTKNGFYGLGVDDSAMMRQFNYNAQEGGGIPVINEDEEDVE